MRAWSGRRCLIVEGGGERGGSSAGSDRDWTGYDECGPCGRGGRAYRAHGACVDERTLLHQERVAFSEPSFDGFAALANGVEPGGGGGGVSGRSWGRWAIARATRGHQRAIEQRSAPPYAREWRGRVIMHICGAFFELRAHLPAPPGNTNARAHPSNPRLQYGISVLYLHLTKATRPSPSIHPPPPYRNNNASAARVLSALEPSN